MIPPEPPRFRLAASPLRRPQAGGRGQVGRVAVSRGRRVCLRFRAQSSVSCFFAGLRVCGSPARQIVFREPFRQARAALQISQSDKTLFPPQDGTADNNTVSSGTLLSSWRKPSMRCRRVIPQRRCFLPGVIVPRPQCGCVLTDPPTVADRRFGLRRNSGADGWDFKMSGP